MSRAALLLVLFAMPAWPHVGSPDVYHEGKAGPYSVFVAIRTPRAIPGVAGIEMRVYEPDIRRIRIVPMPLTGEGAKFAPAPDHAVRSEDDPRFFTGSLWIMTSGSWQVRVEVEGERGSGRLAVPVPALAQQTEPLAFAMGATLAALGLLLSAGAVSIVGAASREALLAPGAEPDAPSKRQARRRMVLTGLLIVGVLWLGSEWWKLEAGRYGRYIYKPLEMIPTVEQASRLVLRLRDSGWLRGRRLDDLIPDHTHLMHLFVVRLPELERVWHLHPVMGEAGVFTHELPPMPAGRYQLYADVVHASGLPETMTAEMELLEIGGKEMEGDDSSGAGPGVSQANPDAMVATLADGRKMIWLREPRPLEALRPTWFRFRVEDADGGPARDLELYMGMPGHAVFLKHDRSVYAHVHPSGSAPMAALALAAGAPADPHAGHAMTAELPAEVSFPYGFPSPGDYRIYVQVKLNKRVETGVFDARVR